MSDIADDATSSSTLDSRRFKRAGARYFSDSPIAYISRDAVERISKAKPGDVQEIAGSQIHLLLGYYQLVLDQARKSFMWALIAAGVGLGFFIVAVGFILYLHAENAAIISVVSGALVEAIAGINFYLYSKTSGHLVDFHNRLEGTQRYLLANSICESLEGSHKQAARIELVRTIAQITLPGPTPQTLAVVEKDVETK
jgi:Cyanobacterial TRADD-N associated 2-Transmembrane domain